MIERVIAVNEDGVELEYDLPQGASEEERGRQWQFPVRLYKPVGGDVRLLNAGEMGTRRDDWLKRSDMSRESCGGWFFTWNAFKIECDPQSVLAVLAPFDLRFGNLADGVLYHDAMAASAAPLRRLASGANGQTFVATMQVDPEFVRREQADAQIIVAQMMGRPALSLDDALAVQAATRISGTIVVNVEADATGRFVRKTRTVELDIVAPDGKAEHRSSIMTVEQSSLAHVRDGEAKR